jgi:hypothetical protein
MIADCHDVALARDLRDDPLPQPFIVTHPMAHIEDAPRVRSQVWSGTLRPVFMRDRQVCKNLVRNVSVSAALVSKPTVSAGSFAGLDAKPIIRVNVPSFDIGRRNVFARVRCRPSDTAPRYLNLEAATVYVELERQQIDMCDMHPPKMRIRAREATFAKHWHYGCL